MWIAIELNVAGFALGAFGPFESFTDAARFCARFRWHAVHKLTATTEPT